MKLYNKNGNFVCEASPKYNFEVMPKIVQYKSDFYYWAYGDCYYEDVLAEVFSEAETKDEQLNLNLKSRVTTNGEEPELDGPAPFPINEKTGQHKAYWVLSEEDRKKGFIRPVRDSYIHTVCATMTKMGAKIAETYAVNPKYYSSTFCCECRNHFPVEEFVWNGTNERVGS